MATMVAIFFEKIRHTLLSHNSFCERYRLNGPHQQLN